MRALIVLILLALPASASAASVEVLRSSTSFLSTPTLAGDHVLVNSYPSPNAAELLVGAPGEQSRRLLRLTGSTRIIIAAGSGDRVLVRANDSDSWDLYRGTVTGSLAKAESCPRNPDLDFLPGPALDGDLSAWTAEGCVRDRVQVQFGTVSRTIDVSGLGLGLSAAGHYVAWTSSDGHRSFLTVYDAQAGATAYSVEVKPVDRIDVDADGTAVIVPALFNGEHTCGGGFDGYQVTYYTVAQPTAHVVPVKTCSDSVKIAAGRIAFVEHLAGGGDLLALTDLGATHVQPVARIDAEPTPIALFDYDGSRIAWTQPRCRDSRVLRRDASDTSPEDPAVSCPVKVGAPILRRDGTLHVAVRCPNGCRPEPGASKQGIQIVSPHWLHVVSKRGSTVRYAPFVKVDLTAGRRTVVRLPLTSHQRALLRSRRRVSVRLKLLMQNVYLPRLARTAHA